jgi:hypothetical protein
MWLPYLLARLMEQSIVLGTLGDASVKVVPCFLENANKVLQFFVFLMQGLFAPTSRHFPGPTFLCACSKYIVPADYMCLKWN